MRRTIRARRVRGRGDLRWRCRRSTTTIGRFREIVRGKIKQNLRKYISQGELIGRKGKDTRLDPAPADRHPALPLRRASSRAASGRATATSATRSGRATRASDGPGKAGDRPGEHAARGRAVAATSSPQILGEELRAAATSSPRAQSKIIAQKDRYTGIRTHRPRVAAPLQAHLPRRRCGGRSRPAPTTRRTRSSSRSATTSATARWQDDAAAAVATPSSST